MKDNFAGRHLILDIVSKNKDLLNDISYAEKYMYKITEITKMQLVIPVISMSFPFNNELHGFVKKLILEGTDSPIIREYSKYVKEKESNDTGISSVGIWNTSHCSSHSWLDKKYISIDLFSCLNYDINPVIDFTNEYYDVSRVDIADLERYIGSPQIIDQFTIERLN